MSNGLNTQEGQLREKERIGAPIPRVPYDYAGWRRQSAPLPRVETPIGSQTPQDFGESRFDSRITLPQQLDNLNEFRAEEQTSLGKIANGIAKMGIFAGTTFLDGTIGMLYGAGKAISEGDWSGLWDNEISNAMSDVQKWSEKALPNYYTESELDGNIHFTANFLGDKFLKNLGFTFGAIGSALLFNKGVGLLKLPKIAEYLTKSKQASAAFSFILGNAVQSLNEARVEANNNSREWYETQKHQLDEYHEKRKEELLNTAVDEADYARLSALEDDAYQRALQRLGEDTARMGNADMAGNFGLLMLTNSMGLGRMYARGFNTQRRILNASRKLNKLQAGKGLSSGTMRGIATGLKDTFVEGAEEMSQSMIAKGTGNYYSNDVMSFYDASIDFETTKNSVDMLNAMGKGIHEQLNDPLAWEEFLIGSLTGATGVIRVGKNNVDVPLIGPVGLQGGVLGATMESRRNAARENAIIKRVNESMANPRITAMLRGINRHVTEQGKMDLAAKEGDSKAFKDAEYNQLISDIITFDACGMLTDYKNLINTTLGNGHLTDEQLQSIRESTKNIVDGKDVGPYAEFTEDADGNNKMREKLEQTRKALLEAVDQYQEAYKEIDMQTDGIFSEDQLAELVWMKTRLGDWANRSKELTSSIVDRLRNLKEHVYTNRDGKLNEFITVNAVEGEELNLQKLSAYLKSSGKRNIDIDKSVDALVDIIEKNKRMLGPMLVSKADPRSNSTLYMGIEAWLQNLKNKAEELVTDGTDIHIDELLQELRDLQQMTLDAQEFNNKLTEFMADPKKFEAAHKKSNKKAKKAETKHKAEKVVEEAKTQSNAGNDSGAKATLNNAEPEVKAAAENDPWVKYFNNKIGYLEQLSANIDSLEDIPQPYRAAAREALEEVFRSIQTPKSFSDFVNNPWAIISDLGLDSDPYRNFVINAAFQKQTANEEFAKLFSQYTPPTGAIVFSDPKVSNDGVDSTNPSVSEEPPTKEDQFAPAGNAELSIPNSADFSQDATDSSQPINSISYLQTGLPLIALESRPRINKDTNTWSNIPEAYNTPSYVIIDAQLPVNRQAAWEYIYGTTDGRPITYKDLLMSPEFTKGSEIYFGIKKDITYKFDNDPIEHYVVFMYWKNPNTNTYIPVGTVITRPQYKDAVALIERVSERDIALLEEQQDMLGNTIYIHPSLKTNVHTIKPGFIPYIDHENNLKDIIKPEDISGDNPKVRFGIVKNKSSKEPGIFTIAGVSDIFNKIRGYNPMNLNTWSGRIVMMIPRADELYTAVPVRTKPVSADNIIANKNTPFYHEIYEAINTLINTTDTYNAGEALKTLRQLLYMGNIRIGYYNMNPQINPATGEVINNFTKVKDEDDKSTETNADYDVLGFVNRTDYDTWQTEREADPNKILPTRHLIKTGDTDSDIRAFLDLVKDSREENAGNIVYYNIDVTKLNNSEYISNIIQGGVLTCNIEKPETYGDFFTIPTYDTSTGKMYANIEESPATSATPTKVLSPTSQSGITIELPEYINFNNSGNNYKVIKYPNGIIRAHKGDNSIVSTLETVNLGNGVTAYLSQVLEQLSYLHDKSNQNLYKRFQGFLYKNQSTDVCIFDGIDNYLFVKNGDRYDIVTDPASIQVIKTTINSNNIINNIAAAGNIITPTKSESLALSYTGSFTDSAYNIVKKSTWKCTYKNASEDDVKTIYYLANDGQVSKIAGIKVNDNIYLSGQIYNKDGAPYINIFFVNANGYRSNRTFDTSIPLVLEGKNVVPAVNTIEELLTKVNQNAIADATNAMASPDTSKDLRKFFKQEAPVIVTTPDTTNIESVIPDNNTIRIFLEAITESFTKEDSSGNKVINRDGGVYVDNFGKNYLRFHCLQGFFNSLETPSFNIASNDPSRKQQLISDPIIEGNIYDAYLRSYFMHGDAAKAEAEANKAYSDFFANTDPSTRTKYLADKDKYLSNLNDKFKDVRNIYNRLKNAGYKFLTNNLIVSAHVPYSKDNSNVNPVTSYLRIAGEMDMLMEKDGEYYIIDFKNSKSDPSLNEFYRMQLAFYKYALENSSSNLSGKVHTYGWIWHDKNSNHDSLVKPNDDIKLEDCSIPITAEESLALLGGSKAPNTLFFSRVAEKAAMELQANAGTVVQTSVEPQQNNEQRALEELINHLRESGFTVKGKADMEKFLQENGLNDVQESLVTPEVEQEMQQIKAQAIADGTFMKAPNGNPTNLGERQWLQVRTKAFKNWFGDWESVAARIANAKVIWGHPGIGKTEYYKNNNNVIDFDSVYKPRINEELGLPEGAEERKKWRREHREEYRQKILSLFDEAVEDAKKQGKQLLVSDMVVLQEREEALDLITQMSEDTFAKRSAQRNEPYDDNKKLWKADIDESIARVSDKSKVVNTEKYLSELYEDAKDVSKVVDENGEPLVVYHGSKDSWTIYDKNRFKRDQFGRGIYLSEDYNNSDSYGKVRAFFVNARHPFYAGHIWDDNGNRNIRVSAAGLLFNNETIDKDNYIKELKRYVNENDAAVIGKELSESDAVVVSYKGSSSEPAYKYGEIVVSNPNQIKSATDNNGNYSPKNNNIQMFIGKKARTQFEQYLRKARPDMSSTEIKSTLDFLHSLEDNKENTAYIKTAVKWISNRSLTLPQDHEKAYQAFELARKKRIDLQKFNTLGELITSPEMQPKEKEKPSFNPDTAKTFSNKRTVTTESGRIFTVYDVKNTEEGQREVCKALAAHYKMSPWCLSTFTATGEPTESAKHFWNVYDALPRKIAYENGKPVAFNSDKINDPKFTFRGQEVIKYRNSDYKNKFELNFYPENIKELISEGIVFNIYEGDNDMSPTYRFTDKGEALIEQHEAEAWWDMEDTHSQDSLSDSIVSEPKQQLNDFDEGNVQEFLTAEDMGWYPVDDHNEYITPLMEALTEYESALMNAIHDVVMTISNELNVNTLHSVDVSIMYLNEINREEITEEMADSEEIDSIIQNLVNQQVDTAFKQHVRETLVDYNSVAEARNTPVNPNLNQEDDFELPFFKTSQGEIYGFVDKDNNIYIDEEVATTEIPIHEYTHLWDRVVAKDNSELWQRGAELMKQLPLWSEIEKDPNYGAKWNDRDDKEFLIASEVHARLVGKEGNKEINKSSDKSAIAALKQWLKDFWDTIKSTFSKWTKKDLDDLTIEDFVKMPIKDFLNRENLVARLNDVEPTVQDSSNEIANAIDEELGDLLLREASDAGTFDKADIDKEVKWLRNKLGISENGGLEIVDTLIELNNEHGTKAYGQFKDATITLSKMMTKGTAYHEAFHTVFHLMLKPSEICDIVDEAVKRYNISDSIKLEENLANDFMDYMIDEEYVGTTLSSKIKAFFTKLKRFLNHILGLEDYIDGLFYRIKNGSFAGSYSEDIAKSANTATLVSKAILANNRQPLDTASNGQKSELYEALKRELGGTDEAIVAKAIAMSPDFIGWLSIKQSSEGLSNESLYDKNGEVKASFVLERLQQLGMTDLHSYIPYNSNASQDDNLSIERYTKIVKSALQNIPVSKLKDAYNKFVNDYLNKYGIQIIGTVKNKTITIKDVLDRRKVIKVFNDNGEVKSINQIISEDNSVTQNAWETLTHRQRQLLSNDNLDSDTWNSLSYEEQQSIIECL